MKWRNHLAKMCWGCGAYDVVFNILFAWKFRSTYITYTFLDVSDKMKLDASRETIIIIIINHLLSNSEKI